MELQFSIQMGNKWQNGNQEDVHVDYGVDNEAEDTDHKEDMEHQTISFNRNDRSRPYNPNNGYDNTRYRDNGHSYPAPKRFRTRNAGQFDYPGLPVKGSTSDNLSYCIVRNLHYLDQVLAKCVILIN